MRTSDLSVDRIGLRERGDENVGALEVEVHERRLARVHRHESRRDVVRHLHAQRPAQLNVFLQ